MSFQNGIEAMFKSLFLQHIQIRIKKTIIFFDEECPENVHDV